MQTKIWITDYGFDETVHAFDKSAGKLGVDVIDLLLLHQAMPGEFDQTLDAYRALERLLEEGKVRAIGVSNFMVEHLRTLRDRTYIIPAVNQIEMHPFFTQPAVCELHNAWNIPTQAWSPLGGITDYLGTGATTFQDETLGAIAAKHQRTPAQMAAIDALDTGERGGPDPDEVTLETFGKEIPEA